MIMWVLSYAIGCTLTVPIYSSREWVDQGFAILPWSAFGCLLGVVTAWFSATITRFGARQLAPNAGGPLYSWKTRLAITTLSVCLMSVADALPRSFGVTDGGRCSIVVATAVTTVVMISCYGPQDILHQRANQ